MNLKSLGVALVGFSVLLVYLGSRQVGDDFRTEALEHEIRLLREQIDNLEDKLVIQTTPTVDTVVMGQCEEDRIRSALTLTSRIPPQDFRPYPQPKRPLRLCFLFRDKYVKEGKDRREAAMYTAFKNDDRFDATLFGPGFDGWNDEISTRENIETRFGNANYFDIVYWDVGLTWVDPPDNVRSIISCHVHESYGGGLTQYEPTHQKTDVMFFAYPDVQWRATQERSYFEGRTLYYHVDHPAGDVFCQHNNLEKTVDITMLGRIQETLYPFRTRFDAHLKRMVDEGSPYNIVRLEDGQSQEEYAKAMCRSKFVFITGGHSDWVLRKYNEALMCGAVIIGRIPRENYQFWQDIVQPVPHDSYVGFKAVLENLVPRWASLQKVADTVKPIACEELRYSKLVDVMFEVWMQYRENKVRGVFWDKPFYQRTPPEKQTVMFLGTSNDTLY